MLDSWLPKSAPFFEYLLEQNKRLCSLCSLIPRAMEGGRAVEAEINTEASRLEEEGDVIYTAVIESLAQTFITPIDREDILRISIDQENTIDLLQNLVPRLFIFDMNPWTEQLLTIARNMAAMGCAINAMLTVLTQRKGTPNMHGFRNLRNECETLISCGLREALDVSEMTTESVFRALKLTRAYDRMEQALIQLVELAEAVKEAVLKNV